MKERTIHVGDAIDQAVAEIRALKGTDVTTLDLEWNALWKKPITELTALIDVVEGTGITHISFLGNSLGKKSTTELVVLFNALKKTSITHLNLSLNNFKNKSAEELQTIFAAIPENIISVSFDSAELTAMNESQLQAIRSRFNQPESIILYHDQDIELEPSLHTKDANANQALDFKTSPLASSNKMNISMMVLGGFIAAAGIAAVAIAFAVLNAATFGVAGLVAAGVGIAVVISGIGLFATGASKNRQTTTDTSLAFANSPAHS